MKNSRRTRDFVRNVGKAKLGKILDPTDSEKKKKAYKIEKKYKSKFGKKYLSKKSNTLFL
jgi:hypothetical protein